MTDRYIIAGGKALRGEVSISGAKNAAVAIIPAAIMIKGVCRIENLPQISDTETLLRILEYMGAKVNRLAPGTVEIDTTDVQIDVLPDEMFELTRKIRASYYLVGAMLSRFGAARSTLPGGCNFGERPIDQHLKGFKALGAKMDLSAGYIVGTSEKGHMVGKRIYLDKVSVGATINIMLAATLAEGRTIIENVAHEPHVVDVANFLNSMGADIRGAGTDVIKINGVESLHGGSYTLIPDQIEAGTYMAAVASAGGIVKISNVIPKHLDCISAKLREMGVEVEEGDDYVIVRRDKELQTTDVKTMPYPGFPTDMQPQITTVLSLAKGTSVVTEGVYEGNRFKYVSELIKMGANVRVDGKVAIIEGVEKLRGAKVSAFDLRAGAAMVVAGLGAAGITEIDNIQFIERGYEAFEAKLTAIGADIRCLRAEPRVSEDEKTARIGG